MANFVTPDKTASQKFTPGGIYFGKVTRVDSGLNRVWVRIPRFINNFEFGPLAVVGPELPVVDDRVACLFVENRSDDIVVIGVVKNQSMLPTAPVLVATSSTHPDSPKVGTILYETDTEDIFVWNGSEWLTFFEVNLPATIYADLQGTAASATFAVTAASATIAGSVADNSVVLGDDTTGDYVGTITAGTGVSISAGSGTGEGSTPTLAIGQSVGTSDSPSFSTVTSTVATGTAPLTVASTTAVTNLNADLLDGEEGSFYTDVGNMDAGVLPIARGGTNNGSLGVTDGGIIYADGSKLMTTSAGTSGQVLTSAGTGTPAWSSTPSVLPWGYLGQDSTTSASSGATTSYVDSALSLTVSSATGRKIKWTATGHCYSDTAGMVIRVALRSGANSVLAVTDVLVSTANFATGFTLVYFDSGASSVTRKISVVKGIGASGTVYFFADATRTAYLTCEDVGT